MHAAVSLFVLGKRMGCFGEEIPPECRIIIDNVHIFLESTSKILFGLPLHKFWRTKNWKALVGSVDNMLRIGCDQVNEKVNQLSAQQENCKGEGEDVYAELGTDFLTYMVHSGSMDIQKIAANAIDLILAGVDTVRMHCSYSYSYTLIKMHIHPDKPDYVWLLLPAGH